jgi:hypothetical protein
MTGLLWLSLEEVERRPPPVREPMTMEDSKAWVWLDMLVIVNSGVREGIAEKNSGSYEFWD